MSTYHFTAYLASVSEVSDADVDRLFEAGCDDGTPVSRNGEACIAFSRVADSLDSAIRSAIADIARGGQQVSRAELESDDLEELARAPTAQSA
jgi:hypothetical protein